ncbi:hypothetical protein ACOXXX_09090 [Thalassococcus sp. BH17M4-6]|uniref:hypothetical protein n=1 Tax=Thalassococcus sp. BH17M4-6 TaxID=3413148 RepID=UPI003BCD2106
MKTAVLALFFALTACSAVDPVTLMRLSGLSPLEADPGDFEVIAHLPDGLDLPDGGAELSLSATRGDQSLEGRYILERRGAAEARRLRVAPADLVPLRRLQARIRAWEAVDPDGTTGSMSLSITACRTGAGPDPDDRMSAGIILEPGGPERPLLRPVKVRRYEEMLAETAKSGVKACTDVP